MLILGSAATADGVAAVVEVDAQHWHDQHSIPEWSFFLPTTTRSTLAQLISGYSTYLKVIRLELIRLFPWWINAPTVTVLALHHRYSTINVI